MIVTRRKFMSIFGVAAVGAVGAPLIMRTEVGLVKGMLYKHLPDLRIDEERLNTFAENFILNYKNTGWRKRSTIITGARMVEALPDAFNRKFLPELIKSPIRHLEQELFKAFFLGTDYLDVYKETDRMVRFLFIPDPYKLGCSNRLARFDS